MGLQENKAVYTRFIEEAFNHGNFSHLGELLTPDYQVHDTPPGTPPGAEAVKSIVAMFRSGFPDMHITLDELIAEGDTVAARATLRGTHRGEFMGLPATGRSVTVPSLTMVHLKGGKITESWVKNDVAALMRQLQPEPAR